MNPSLVALSLSLLIGLPLPPWINSLLDKTVYTLRLRFIRKNSGHKGSAKRLKIGLLILPGREKHNQERFRLKFRLYFFSPSHRHLRPQFYGDTRKQPYYKYLETPSFKSGTLDTFRLFQGQFLPACSLPHQCASKKREREREHIPKTYL